MSVLRLVFDTAAVRAISISEMPEDGEFGEDFGAEEQVADEAARDHAVEVSPGAVILPAARGTSLGSEALQTIRCSFVPFHCFAA